jgi:hypothetical protein
MPWVEGAGVGRRGSSVRIRDEADRARRRPTDRRCCHFILLRRTDVPSDERRGCRRPHQQPLIPPPSSSLFSFFPSLPCFRRRGNKAPLERGAEKRSCWRRVHRQEPPRPCPASAADRGSVLPSSFSCPSTARHGSVTATPSSRAHDRDDDANDDAGPSERERASSECFPAGPFCRARAGSTGAGAGAVLRRRGGLQGTCRGSYRGSWPVDVAIGPDDGLTGHHKTLLERHGRAGRFCLPGDRDRPMQRGEAEPTRVHARSRSADALRLPCHRPGPFASRSTPN